MRRLCLVLITAAAACGGPTPINTPPPLHASAAPPAPLPPRARWVFSSPEREIAAKLELGGDRTLYVGGHGRRHVEAKGADGGAAEDAGTLADEALGGVMRDDKGRFVFVATDGDTWASKEPLGALERIGPARREPLASIATGRAAIVGIEKGALVRSTDWGKTWRSIPYTSEKLVGHAASVALDGKGNGVLVHLPQRLFVTHDDGATWAPLASPPRGATSALRDGGDRLFVFGYHGQGAVLAKDGLVETSEAPTPIIARQPLRQSRELVLPRKRGLRGPPMPTDFDEPREPTRLLVGDRVVELAPHDDGKSEKIDKVRFDTRAARLGEPMGAATAHEDLGSGVLAPDRLATWDGELAYLRAPDEKDDADPSSPPASTIMRSADFGVTWKKGDAIPGVVRDDLRAIAIGPRGWTYVGPTCARPRSSECKPPKIKPAGKAAFVELEVAGDTSEASEANRIEPRAFAFDDAHHAVYALADGPGGPTVYEGSLEGAKLTRVPVTLDGRFAAMSVDDAGALRVFARRGNGVVTMYARPLKGEVSPARYLEIGDGALAFAGRRGLAIGNHASYETGDGGETWTRVPSNGSTSYLACGPAGCLLDGAQRVGWDLPSVQSSEIVRASATPPAETSEPSKKTAPAITPTMLACKTSGKASAPIAHGGFDYEWIGVVANSARWARVEHDYVTSGASITWLDASAVHRASLLGPSTDAGPTQVRTASDQHDDAVVAARYRFAPRTGSGDYNPVSVELAWWSAAKAQVHRATLPRVKPFRVSRLAFSGTARVVDGGVVFQGAPGDVVHFARDDGKIETLTAPGLEFHDAWRSGNRWLLADATEDTLELASSDDGGKTWTLHGWGLGAGWYGDSLQPLDGKPIVRGEDALYPIPWPVPSDPPAPITLDATTTNAPCGEQKIGTLTHRERVEDAPPVVMVLDGNKFSATERVSYDTATGKQCAAAYVLEQGDDTAYVYADKGGWSGWIQRVKDDKVRVEPLSCK